MLKVLHVTPAYYPATYWGGPIFSTLGLCDALAARDDIEITVLSIATSGPRSGDRMEVASRPMRYPGGYDVHFVDKWAGRDIAPGIVPAMFRLARDADVLHLTATYSFPSLPALLVARSLGKPLVWSPRGAIQAASEWDGARRQTLKRAWEQIATALRPAETVVHVTAEVERRACEERLPGVKTVVIPNGVDVPVEVPDRIWRPGGQLRLMYLGRLDVKKGIENLLVALASLPGNVTLDIYGTGDPAYANSLSVRAAELGLAGRVTLHGHVDGDRKRDALIRADVLVLASFSENFGMAIVEALAHGTPVVTSRATPWAEVEARGCGLWVDNDPASLAAAVEKMAQADLAAMGQRGRSYVLESFSWTAIAASMRDVYRGLVTRPADGSRELTAVSGKVRP